MCVCTLITIFIRTYNYLSQDRALTLYCLYYSVATLSWGDFVWVLQPFLGGILVWVLQPFLGVIYVRVLQPFLGVNFVWVLQTFLGVSFVWVLKPFLGVLFVWVFQLFLVVIYVWVLQPLWYFLCLYIQEVCVQPRNVQLITRHQQLNYTESFFCSLHSQNLN